VFVRSELSSREDFPKNAIIKKQGDVYTYNWAGKIAKYMIPRMEEYKAEGMVPTIRGMFYYLTDSQVVAKLYNAYKGFDKALVTARKKRPSQWGYVPIGTLSDNTRRIIDISDKYLDLETQIESAILRLIDIPDTFKDSIPRWLGQPNYVEVWIEKEGMTSTIYSILKDSKVRIAPNRGWGRWSFYIKISQDLRNRYRKIIMDSLKV
jgi:hypothetical protein